MREFKDLGRLTGACVAALSIDMLFELASGLLSFWTYRSADADYDPQAAGLADYVALAALVVLIVCIILVGRWIYRASVNAHTLSDEMTISPGWAVGWYFVPIANLFKPYQGMREIWMASHFRGNWHGEPTPQLLVAWWALWIVTNILGNISFRLGMNDSEGQMIATTTTIDLVAALLNLPLCLILIMMMRKIAAAQSHAPYEETFA